MICDSAQIKPLSSNGLRKIGCEIQQHGARPARCLPNALSIFVDDDGRGIPTDRHDDVFTPFRRPDSARGQELPGSGLDLTIARGVVQSHSGVIELVNRAGGGLTVKISMPRR